MSHHEEKNHLENVASFFHQFIHEKLGLNNSAKILDFGCGAGQLVRDLQQYGYDAYGCDVLNYEHKFVSDRLSEIQINPYRLPFENNSFDIVVSTSVLEHAPKHRRML